MGAGKGSGGKGGGKGGAGKGGGGGKGKDGKGGGKGGKGKKGGCGPNEAGILLTKKVFDELKDAVDNATEIETLAGKAMRICLDCETVGKLLTAIVLAQKLDCKKKKKKGKNKGKGGKGKGGKGAGGKGGK